MQRIHETPKRFHCSRSTGCDVYPGGDFDCNLPKFQNLWRAITGSQNELLRWERSLNAPVSLAQGEIAEEEDPLFGFAWDREIEDTEPLPGIIIRRVYYRLKWNEAGSEYSYDAELYVKPTDPR